MVFSSILYPVSENSEFRESGRIPDFFTDLNLDLVINTISKGKDEYNLKPFFHVHLTDPEVIAYRQNIFRDLEDPALLEAIKSFAEKMRTIRKQLAATDKLFYRYHKERWFIETVNSYCSTIEYLSNDLDSLKIKSEGFLSFRSYLHNYLQSEHFKAIAGEVNKTIRDLSTIQYSVLYRDLKVQVSKNIPETDFNKEIEKAFSKFIHNPVKDYKVGYAINTMDMNHVETSILDGVAYLYPDVFSRLDTFFTDNKVFLDKTINEFDREIQFYIAYLDFIKILKNKGLKFCYPEISKKIKEVYCSETFDIALAYRLSNEKLPVVLNDICLKDNERIIVVSGPNQGGKTTFARMFGQLHYLSNLGCPVPGIKARLFLFDKLFTHFEKEENIQNLRGKLQDDLIRIHNILLNVTSDSIVVLNELFASTALQDQVFLSRQIMRKLLKLDLLCVWVTFIDELATLSQKNVSMISTVVPENPAVRTFKIVGGPADGIAYAISIAEKYSLTYNYLKKRLRK